MWLKVIWIEAALDSFESSKKAASNVDLRPRTSDLGKGPAAV